MHVKLKDAVAHTVHVYIPCVFSCNINMGGGGGGLRDWYLGSA